MSAQLDEIDDVLISPDELIRQMMVELDLSREDAEEMLDDWLARKLISPVLGN